jgi:transcriptional regulator with XRE-family HTH domain
MITTDQSSTRRRESLIAGFESDRRSAVLVDDIQHVWDNGEVHKRGTEAMVPGDPTELGRFIRARREALALSLRALEKRSGVDHTYIYALEQGEIQTPSPEKLQRLARELEVEIEDLYSLAGYAIPEHLPEFSPYLRAKYDFLPSEAVSQLETYFQLLREKYGVGEDEEGSDG